MSQPTEIPTRDDEKLVMKALRVNPTIWNAAKTKAESEGQSLSNIIRALLKLYIEG